MSPSIVQIAIVFAAFAAAAFFGSQTPRDPETTISADNTRFPAPLRVAETGESPPATPFAARLALADALTTATTAQDFRHLLFAPEFSNWQAQQLVLARWCDIDAAAAAETLIADAIQLHRRRQAIDLVFGSWARSDPDAAYAAAARFTDPEDCRWAAALAIFDADAESDPATAIARYAAIEPTLGTELENFRLPPWAERDPAGAARLALALPPESEWRKTLFPDIVALWIRADPTAALDFVGTLGDDIIQDPIADRAVAALAETDVVAALVWIDANVTGIRRQSLVSDTLQALAWSDPAAAAPLIAEAGAARFGKATAALIGNLVETDLPAALDWAIAHWDGKSDAITRPLVRNWASQDLSSLAEFVSTSEEPIVTWSFVAEVAESMASSDLSGAIAWASTLPASRGSVAIRSVFETDSWRNPTAMADRLSGLPTPELRDSAAAAVANGFNHFPPGVFEAWFATHPYPAARDAVARAVANIRELAPNDPFGLGPPQ